MSNQAQAAMAQPESLAETLEEVLAGRRSIRRFSGDPVREEDIRRIVRAGGLAPSAGNQQMWRFLVVRSRALIDQMHKAVLEAVEDVLSWEESREYEGRISGMRNGATFFAQAPVTIAVLSKAYDQPLDLHVLPARGYTFEQVYRLRGDPGRQSVGGAIQNMLLMAHALGYGACWMCGPLVAGPALERLLKVEEPWRLVALVPVGVPAQSPGVPNKKSQEEISAFVD
ncbi:MAG: nitroreductase family protein [Dehalococcoidia bacterium]|nr:nitroreductase family protein [Dehalococcoidia bacterium]